MDLQAGQLVDDRFEVLRPAGRGEWHKLYEVVDRSSGDRFDLKIIDAASARNAKRREDFVRQAQLAQGLHHQNLLAVVGLGEHQGSPYLLTEHAPAESLGDLLARQGRIKASELLPIAIQLCSALDFLHARGIIHRDVRPDAVVMSADGVWKLRDFEMARDVGAQQTIALPGGAPPYRSPEQLLGRSLDARSDIYSVGALLYEMLTGSKPLEGVDVISRFMQPPPNAIEVAPDCPPELSAAVSKCLEPEVGQRFGGVADLATALINVRVEDEPTAAVAEERPAPMEADEIEAPEPVPEPVAPPEPEPVPEPEVAPKPVVAAAPPTAPELPAAAPPPAPVADPPPPPPPPPPAPAPVRPVPKPIRKPKPRRTLAVLMGEEPGRTAQVIAVLRQIISRLQQMREEGLHHAPLSPDSIRVPDNKIEIDAIDPPEPGQTVAIRQPKYHAPEWLLETPLDGPDVERADLYALGFIAYEWLAGRDGFQQSFPHDDSAQPKMEWMRWQSDAAASAPPLGDNRSWVPRALSDLVSRMIAKNPADALTSYAEADEALAAVLVRVEDTQHAGPAPKLHPDAETGGGLPLWAKIAIGVGAGATAVAAWWLLSV